ncbi:MAG: hypothetical protein ACF8CQ_24130, partial [Rhodopirellula sp. JB044]|uniref:hypothetical protein n=1 Tax=Rhodopirellula sp. JB044 TaxID=3342844 RepID=UPI00370BE4E0
ETQQTWAENLKEKNGLNQLANPSPIANRIAVIQEAILREPVTKEPVVQWSIEPLEGPAKAIPSLALSGLVGFPKSSLSLPRHFFVST